jgi:hypothetical protein
MEAEGSDHLSFDAYKLLCSLAIKSNSTYGHLFLVLSWNLMLRCASTGDLLFKCMSWCGDHIVFHIPRHKGDPTGERGPTCKSLFANPFNPSIDAYCALVDNAGDETVGSAVCGTRSIHNVYLGRAVSTISAIIFIPKQVCINTLIN